MSGISAPGFMDKIFNDSQHLETYPKGRRCKHENCITVLSVYNPSEYCMTHEPEEDPMTYGGFTFRICARCEVVKDIRDYEKIGDGRDTLCKGCRQIIDKASGC
jgi:hypothetical protein